jgi:hypothetical protein
MLPKGWAESTDPIRMVRALMRQSRPPTLRKLRLYSVATCRRFRERLPGPEARAAVETLEAYVEGQSTWPDVVAARQRASEAHTHTSAEAFEQRPVATRLAEVHVGYYWQMVDFTLNQSASRWSSHSPNGYDTGYNWVVAGLRADLAARFPDPEQAALVRCVFGDVARRSGLDRRHVTTTVATFARQMYESKDFSPMPILADALQDAGCDNDDVLNHCRGAGPHVRGCWVVDLVLGKE